MKIIFTMAAILAFGSISCKKEKSTFKELSCPVNTVEGSKNKIIGKWKLVSGYFLSQTPAEVSTPNDYSCNNIIYEFRADGKLVVTSDIAEYVGDAPGTVDYVFGTEGGNQSKLSIDAIEQNATLSSTTLDINNSASDWWILKLVRIE